MRSGYIFKILMAGLLLVLLLPGCATNKIDWAARVGIYTYDQAVRDMGPADKWAKLEDNTIVADWMTRRGHYINYSSGGPAYYAYGFGPVVYPSYNTVWSPDYFLRLTFGPDGKLQSWKNFAR